MNSLLEPKNPKDLKTFFYETKPEEQYLPIKINIQNYFYLV